MLSDIPYIEDIDFNNDNTLKYYVSNGKPVVMMVQGNFCGYCSQAKPAFKQFVDSNSKVTGVTLQIDGKPSEKNASKIIPMLYSDYKGVPVYLGFDKNGRFVKCHDGGRDVNSLMTFANSLA